MTAPSQFHRELFALGARLASCSPKYVQEVLVDLVGGGDSGVLDHAQVTVTIGINKMTTSNVHRLPIHKLPEGLRPVDESTPDPDPEPEAPALCQGTTRAGKPCRNKPVDGTRFCRTHSGAEALREGGHTPEDA